MVHCGRKILLKLDIFLLMLGLQKFMLTAVFLCNAVLVTRPVESHSGALGNILARPSNIFTGPLWGENF